MGRMVGDKEQHEQPAVDTLREEGVAGEQDIQTKTSSFRQTAGIFSRSDLSL